PPLSGEEARALAAGLESPDGRRALVASEVHAAARAVRDASSGRVVTYSPKVFLPLTNLCRNRCDYCSFRRSPGDAGEWTMSPGEVEAELDRASAAGCAEALFCLGDKPEKAFSAYRRTLASFGQTSTVEYLHWASKAALDRGLLPHTNAGILTGNDMTRLKEVNVSLGLMLECSSPRLCEPGMPHHRAPDKRPDVRIAMIDEAGRLRIPFTTGILVGIGETLRERVESLLVIRDLHRAHGHIQEVIVQNFRAVPGVPMARAPEPADDEITLAVALARVVLDRDVSLQAPPNLNPAGVEALLASGLNDFGGISPVTPDYINPRHPWPHVDALGEVCATAGFELRPRTALYPDFAARPGFLDASLAAPLRKVESRIVARSAS
ncbi:MAG: 7,8-didemethyl-8-hydroxy-5-deazariboflavin synthase CofG, partial [Polyangiaceae bacterium]